MAEKTVFPPDTDALRARRYKTPRTVLALVLREMSTTYGRSPGGYIWAILEPAGAITLLAFAFGLLLRTPSLGTSFILFYATGYLPFSLYSLLASKIAKSIKFSKALLAYPSVTYADAILARFLLNLITQIMVFYVVLTGIEIFVDPRAILDFEWIILGLAMAAALGLGVGVMNCFLMAVVPVWENIWKIVNRPLFLFSAVLYIIEDLPGWARDILWWNPLAHVTGTMRRGFFATYEASYVSLPYVFGIALVLIATGFVLLGRYHREILNER